MPRSTTPFSSVTVSRHRVREFVCAYRPLRDAEGHVVSLPTLVLNNPETAARALTPLLAQEPVEVFAIACLSARKRLLAWLRADADGPVPMDAGLWGESAHLIHKLLRRREQRIAHEEQRLTQFLAADLESRTLVAGDAAVARSQCRLPRDHPNPRCPITMGCMSVF